MKREKSGQANLSSSAGKLETTENGIGTRIRTVRGDRTQAIFASSHGVGLSSLMRWERGETKPDSDFLTALVEREGVDGTWLLTGREGPSTPADPRAPAMLQQEMDLLLECYVAVEGILSKNGRYATHDQKKILAISMLEKAKTLDLPHSGLPEDLTAIDSGENRA